EPKSKEEFDKAVGRLQELIPIKESEEIFRPLHKLAVAGNETVIKECIDRLKELDFEYEIFGGNDYHMVEEIGDIREAKLVKEKVGSGYCPLEFFEDVKSSEYEVDLEGGLRGRKIASLPLVSISVIGPSLERFIFAYGTEIIAREYIDAVNDEEDKIFVYNPVRYLVP
ncbi:MAG: hypothetical protein QXO71_11210, partial [Candidatus Jordarchaeaceae archaeon]